MSSVLTLMNKVLMLLNTVLMLMNTVFDVTEQSFVDINVSKDHDHAFQVCIY